MYQPIVTFCSVATPYNPIGFLAIPAYIRHPSPRPWTSPPPRWKYRMI